MGPPWREPSADWHVADRPTVRDEAVLIVTLCGEIVGEPKDLERARFGIVVGNRCLSCQRMLLNEPR